MKTGGTARGRRAAASLAGAACIFLLGVAGAEASPGDVLLVSGPNTKNAEGFEGADVVPATSGTGEWIAFLHEGPLGPHLEIPGDSLFLRSARAPALTPVDVPSGESAGQGYDAGSPSLDREGNLLAFVSEDPDLSGEDKNFDHSVAGTSAVRDVFVYDRGSRRTTLVSRASGPRGAAADDDSNLPTISEDGRYVAFGTEAHNLASRKAFGRVIFGGVYVRDLKRGTTTLVSRADGRDGEPLQSYDPSISRHGGRVAFVDYVGHKRARRSVIMVRDVKHGRTAVVSRSSGGSIAAADCTEPALAAAGRYVAFASEAGNLVPGVHGSEQVFVRDLKTGRTVLASRSQKGAAGGGDSSHPSISADGRYVAFESYANNLGPPDQGRFTDVFVKDLKSGLVYLASRAPGGGPAANAPSANPSISSSGHFVSFESRASNLSPQDTDRASSVFRYQILP